LLETRRELNNLSCKLILENIAKNLLFCFVQIALGGRGGGGSKINMHNQDANKRTAVARLSNYLSDWEKIFLEKFVERKEHLLFQELHDVSYRPISKILLNYSACYCTSV
jgi:acetyl/propionyl-CoA carboxylase alpha subunit